MRVLGFIFLTMLPFTFASGSEFTYQGQLHHAGSPFSGSANLSFFLFDSAEGGQPIGPVQSRPGWPVADGLFQVDLDFESLAFDGGERWLEVWVNGVVLGPRQKISVTPMALHALNVPAETLSSLDCLAGEQPMWNGVQWTCVWPEDQDTLGDLTCAVGQIAKWSGAAWTCAIDEDTTYVAGSGLSLSGNEFSLVGSGYANVLVVAKSGGDFDSVQAAIDSIADASAENPWLVWVAPGVYEGRVVMKPYVSLRGAGQASTILRSHGGNLVPGPSYSSVTLLGADHTFIEDLTIESRAAGLNYAYAMVNEGTSPTIRRVTLLASDAASWGMAILNRNSARPTMESVTARSVNNLRGRAIIIESDSAVRVRDVVAEVQGPGAVDGSSAWAISIASSSVDMANVRAFSSGAQSNTALTAFSASDVRLSNMMLASGAVDEANGGSHIGLNLGGGSRGILDGVLAEAYGGSNCYGIIISLNVEVDARNVRAKAAECSGVENGMEIMHGSFGLFRDAFFSGPDWGIRTFQTGTVRVVNSQINGPVGSNLVCRGNYDENLADVNCP